LTGFWHTVLGLTIGVCKASLVGLFFMHLIDSPRATRAVVIVAVFWLVMVLMGLTYSDYVTRSLFPFTPGH
jgi:caa(3)-type oxidase subunit IV